MDTKVLQIEGKKPIETAFGYCPYQEGKQMQNVGINFRCHLNGRSGTVQCNFVDRMACPDARKQDGELSMKEYRGGG